MSPGAEEGAAGGSAGRSASGGVTEAAAAAAVPAAAVPAAAVPAAAVPAPAVGAEHDAVAEPGVGGSASTGAAAAAAAGAPATDPESAARRAGRRELTVTVLIALLGGIIAWVSAGRPWATGVAGAAPNTLKVTASGNDLSAGVTALGLTALAGALALFATRRLARRLVGVLLIAAGAGVAVYAFGERGAGHASGVLAAKAAAKGFATRAMDAHMASWWILAVLGGVLVVLAGVATVVRSATWPGMSSRYENAATKAAAHAADTGSAKDLWDALDRGEDPTEAGDAAEPVEPVRPAEPVAHTPTPRAEH